MAKNCRKRSFWINPGFQSQMLGLMISICAFTLTLFYFADFYFFWKLEHHAASIGLKPGHVFFEFIEEQRHAKLWFFALAALADVSLIFWVGLRFSHRIAGPVYRLKMSLLELADRKNPASVKKITFREDDFFPELADAYNEAIEAHGLESKTQDKDKAA